jgi:uncharacterized RDD family membrane protein YckC
MNDIRIQTTQNVSLEFTPANAGDRMLAHIIDYIIFVAWFFIFLLVLGKMGNAIFGTSIGTVTIIVFWAAPILFYDLLCEIFMNGQTVGKKAMNIKVVKLDGTSPSVGAYLIRWIFRIVDNQLFGSTVALLTVAVNGKGQRFGDMAAGTSVVKLRKSVTLSALKNTKVENDYQVMFPEANQLSDRDVVTIKAVMLKFRQTENYELLESVTQKVKEVMGINSDIENLAFLKIVLKDHTHLMTIEE